MGKRINVQQVVGTTPHPHKNKIWLLLACGHQKPFTTAKRALRKTECLEVGCAGAVALDVLPDEMPEASPEDVLDQVRRIVQVEGLSKTYMRMHLECGHSVVQIRPRSLPALKWSRCVVVGCREDTFHLVVRPLSGPSAGYITLQGAARDERPLPSAMRQYLQHMMAVSATQLDAPLVLPTEVGRGPAKDSSQELRRRWDSISKDVLSV